MKRFDGKVRLFCVSNLLVSFIGTGFLGINGYTESIEGPVLSAHEISLTSSDTEPASQFGEGEDNIYALITEGIKAVIEQQEDALEESDTTADVKEEKKEEKKVETKKSTSTRKSSTKKSTSKSSRKKTTSVVTKKETNNSTTYSYAGTKVGDAIVSYAKKFLGLRYSSGTQSLKKGADCSGFTMLIFKHFGVSLPRTVSGQAGKGSSVSKSNLQKGDLVFFKPKGCKSCSISHVAIYIGGGQVIHETRPGRGVAITKIDGLSNIVYVKARRVINSKTKVPEQNTKTTDNSSNTSSTTSTQNNKNEGNVDNNVASNTTTTSSTNTTNNVVSTPTPTPKQEPKVEVKEEPKVDTNGESNN